jgi:hypothetical protein
VMMPNEPMVGAVMQDVKLIPLVLLSTICYSDLPWFPLAILGVLF